MIKNLIKQDQPCENGTDRVTLVLRSRRILRSNDFHNYVKSEQRSSIFWYDFYIKIP